MPINPDHDVCNDLMVDIFERLPPKSIIRFRSLSKYWHSRIASPEFIRNHNLRCSKNPPKVLIKHHIYCGNHECKDIYTLHPVDQLPLAPGSGYIGVPGVEFCSSREVVGSCNGILCLRNNDNCITLWNLSIRRQLIVPRHPSSDSSSRVALGFCFDSVTDDYKIVALSYEQNKLVENNAFIYSLKTDSWSTLPSPSSWFNNVKSKACFFNGILHWVVNGYLSEPSPEDRKHPIRYILTFDLNSHVCGHILLPGRWSIIRQLTTINGCLAVVSWEGNNAWKIRAMKEYCKTESWSVPFEFHAEVFEVIRVFQAVTNGDLVAYYDASTVYNVQTGRLMKLLRFGPCCFNLEMETYVESLELLDNERATTCGETVFSWKVGDSHKRYCRYN